MTTEKPETVAVGSDGLLDALRASADAEKAFGNQHAELLTQAADEIYALRLRLMEVESRALKAEYARSELAVDLGKTTNLWRETCAQLEYERGKGGSFCG